MLGLLVKDELVHLLRNRPIVWTVVLLPTVFIVAILGPEAEVVPRVTLTLLLFVQLAGLVTGAATTAALISDLQHGEPILYLVRPVPRVYWLLARGSGMFVLLVASLLVGVLLMLLVNAAVVQAPLSAPLVLQGVLLTGIPSILMASACGLLVGVFANGIPLGMFAFLVLANNLILGLAMAADKLPRLFPGLPPVAVQGVACAGEIGLALGLMAIAAIRFSQKSI